MSAVENYILEREANQQVIMDVLHQAIIALPGMKSKISYGIPMYYINRNICYMNPLKNGGVELAFMQGIHLSNQSGILLLKNRKQVMGVELFTIEDIPLESIIHTIDEAVLFDAK